MKKAPYLYDASLEIVFGLCVSDVDQILVCADTLVPYPDSGDILITGVSAQSGVDVPFQVDAIRVCRDRIIPAVNS